MVNLSQYYHYSKDNENQVNANERRIIMFTSSYIFQCYQHRFSCNVISLYLLTSKYEYAEFK